MKVATCSQGEPHFGQSSLSPPLLPPPPLLGEPWVTRFYRIFSPQSCLNQPCHLSYHCQHLPLCHHHPRKNSSVGMHLIVCMQLYLQYREFDFILTTFSVFLALPRLILKLHHKSYSKHQAVTRQQSSSFGSHPLPPSSSFVSICLTPL